MATVACFVLAGCAVAPPPSAEELVSSPEIAPIAASDLISVEQEDPSSPGPEAPLVKARAPVDEDTTESLFITLDALLAAAVNDKDGLTTETVAEITSGTHRLLELALPPDEQLQKSHPRLANLRHSLFNYLHGLNAVPPDSESAFRYAEGARDALRALNTRLQK